MPDDFYTMQANLPEGVLEIDLKQAGVFHLVLVRVDSSSRPKR
jgi:hypothetical protein